VSPRFFIVPVLHAMRQSGETGRRERVKDRQEKNAGGDHVERLDLHACDKIGGEGLIGGGGITLQRARDRDNCGCVVGHGSQWSRDQVDGGPTIQMPAAESRCTLRSLSCSQYKLAQIAERER